MEDNLFAEFFTFRKMVSFSLIKGLYILGIITIIIVGLGLQQFGMNLFVSLIVIVAGNLFWRVSCELLILLFSIHQELMKISRK